MADEEDDYLSMSFADTGAARKVETSLQRTTRLKREAAERGRVPSKAERAQKEQAARDAALATKLSDANKGARLMAKMGFKGGALGAADNQGRENPIEVLLKDDRGGIGMDSEKKRKVREAAEVADLAQKKVKVTEDDYRDRNRLERETRKAEGQWWGAMKVLEKLEEDDAGEEKNAEPERSKSISSGEHLSTEPAAHSDSAKLLLRPLIKDRLEKEQARKDRALLLNGLSKRTLYDEVDESYSTEDKTTLLTEIEDLDEENETGLSTYESLPPVERRDKVVDFLRVSYHYCFWCKYRYTDAAMDGCPGLTEDEHG